MMFEKHQFKVIYVINYIKSLKKKAITCSLEVKITKDILPCIRVDTKLKAFFMYIVCKCFNA